MQNKIILWIALATGIILLIPFVAMQFTDEVVWTLFDFIVAGILLLGFGLLFVVLTQKFTKHRMIIGIALLVSLLYIWAELAVGIFTNLGS